MGFIFAKVSSRKAPSPVFSRPLPWRVQLLLTVIAALILGDCQSTPTSTISASNTNVVPSKLAIPSSSALSILLTSHISLPGRRRSNQRPTQLKAATINTNRIKSLNNKEQEYQRSKNSWVRRWSLLHALGFNSLDKIGCVVLVLAIGVSYKHWNHLPLQDCIFAIVYPLYLGIINRCRFQRNQPARDQAVAARSELRVRPLLFQEKGAWFIIYVQFFAMIGLLLPSILCLAGPTVVAAPVASHTMLLFAQVLTEAMTTNPWMHTQPRVMVPIGFNTYRMVTLWIWVRRSWEIGQRSFQQQHHALSLGTQIWVVVGFSLAVINFVGWSYNLFIFLCLRVVPQYWDTDTFPTTDVQWKGQLVPVLGKHKKRVLE